MNSDIQIIVSDEIRAVCPDFVGAALEAEFSNSPYSEALWNEIHQFQTAYTSRYTISSIKEMPSIQATRTAYKRCGKDPSRYRPSGEALVRRMLNGHDLYQINTAVDLVNLASIAYGYSIGGFDKDKIQGHTLTLGIGKAGEPYEGIGRGPLNIEGLPVYRDTMGGIGTPTSDHERNHNGFWLLSTVMTATGSKSGPVRNSCRNCFKNMHSQMADKSVSFKINTR